MIKIEFVYLRSWPIEQVSIVAEGETEQAAERKARRKFYKSLGYYPKRPVESFVLEETESGLYLPQKLFD